MKNKTRPPRWATWLFRQFIRSEDHEYFLDSISEVYASLRLEKGRAFAQAWFWFQLFRSLPNFIKHSLGGYLSMFNNYFKITLRNILKHKGTAFINISGLAIGMACTILIFLWVNNQLDYDRTQPFKDRIYRLEAVDWVCMPTYFRQVLTEFPEIQQFVMFSHWETPTLRYKDSFFEPKNFVFADSNVFEAFQFNFIQGDPQTALQAPFAMVLTESEAIRIFGNTQVRGKTFKYNNRFEMRVTGIIQDVNNLHLEINALARFEDLPTIKQRPKFLEEQNWNFTTYLLLEENTDIARLEQKMDLALNKLIKGEKTDFFLRPFDKIYFSSNIKREKGVKHGNLQLLVLFAAVALFILLIGCINFINLTTARASVRVKEISVRKVVGANKKNLITQFLGETLMTALFSLVFALFLAKFFLPVFNRLIGENLMLKAADPVLVSGVLAILLFSGLAAGIFPAFYLSSLNPITLLKGGKSRKARDFSFRKVLIVVQFSISVFLIVCAFTVSQQTAFLKNADLGFTQDQVLLVSLKGDLLGRKMQTFKELLLRDPRILEISFASQEPGNITNTNTWIYQGKEYPMKVLNTDPEYFTLMELELLSGRNFKREMRTDIGRRYLINQEAAEFMEMDSPLGETVRANHGNSEIIGVIKDYHFNSLHNRIEPLAICWYERWADISHIKIAGGSITSALQHINQIWNEMSPDFPFSYTFLDESFAKKYQQENQLTEILVYFVTLAILLSCLGLLGLSAFVAEQKNQRNRHPQGYGFFGYQYHCVAFKRFFKMGGPFQYFCLAGSIFSGGKMAAKLRLPHQPQPVDLPTFSSHRPYHCPFHGQLPIHQGRRSESYRLPPL